LGREDWDGGTGPPKAAYWIFWETEGWAGSAGKGQRNGAGDGGGGQARRPRFLGKSLSGRSQAADISRIEIRGGGGRACNGRRRKDQFVGGAVRGFPPPRGSESVRGRGVSF